MDLGLFTWWGDRSQLLLNCFTTLITLTETITYLFHCTISSCLRIYQEYILSRFDTALEVFPKDCLCWVLMQHQKCHQELWLVRKMSVKLWSMEGYQFDTQPLCLIQLFSLTLCGGKTACVSVNCHFFFTRTFLIIITIIIIIILHFPVFQELPSAVWCAHYENKWCKF